MYVMSIYYYLIVKFYMFYKVFFIFNYFGGFGFLVFYYMATLPLTFTVIGQNNLMNIYYQSEILSSPHRITAYESM